MRERATADRNVRGIVLEGYSNLAAQARRLADRAEQARDNVELARVEVEANRVNQSRKTLRRLARALNGRGGK